MALSSLELNFQCKFALTSGQSTKYNIEKGPDIIQSPQLLIMFKVTSPLFIHLSFKKPFLQPKTGYPSFFFLYIFYWPQYFTCWNSLWLPSDLCCIEFVWFQYILRTSYQSPKGSANWSFINEKEQSWISNCVRLVFLFIIADQTMGVKTGLKGEAFAGNNLFVGRQWKVINEKEKTRGRERRKWERAQ